MPVHAQRRFVWARSVPIRDDGSVLPISAPIEGEQPSEVLPASRRWLVLGLITVLVLCVLDIAGAWLSRDPEAANLSGTLALAPALTGLGGSRRQTLLTGAVAVLAAVALSLADGVPWATAAVRTGVVLAGAVVAGAVTTVRERHLHQLQERRRAARALQAAMLTRLPAPAHLQLTSRYLPASSGDQVGGDWYDALVDAQGCTVVVIGDVVGHDIHAAAAMGQVRGLLRAYAVEGGQGPAHLLHRLDTAVERLGLEVLASVVVARIEQDLTAPAGGERVLRWSNAGHPPPLLLRESTGAGNDSAADPAARVEELSAEPDPVIGLGMAVQRADHTCTLPPGSTLLLYTDGLIERRERDLTEGLRALKEALSAAAVRTKPIDTAQRPTTPPGAAPQVTVPRGAAVERSSDGAPSARSLDDVIDTVLACVLPAQHQDDVALLAVRAHPLEHPLQHRVPPEKAGSRSAPVPRCPKPLPVATTRPHPGRQP